MKITFLGTGTSTGVPEIGCNCAVCTSGDMRDHRLRTSILVEIGNNKILLDCGPDFRQQIMQLPFAQINAVMLTHEHYDHVGGIDDLRPFCQFGDIDIYAENNVCNAIRTRMPYCFVENKYPGIPKISMHSIKPEAPVNINGIEILPIRIIHGKLPIVGYRIGKMAYLTDVKSIPTDQLWKLRDLDTLIIDALHYKKHPSHESVDEALAHISTIHPKRAYLIHMSHRIGLHAEIEHTLPNGVFLSYDGLQIEIED